MDFLITTLSLINGNNFLERRYTYPRRKRAADGTVTYETVENEHIPGFFTNEAPAKYLISRKLEETYTLFDRIIILGTNECLHNTIRSQFDEAISGAGDKKKLKEEKEKAREFLDMTTLDYYKKIILDHVRASDAGDLKAAFEEKCSQDKIIIFLNVDDLESGEILTRIQQELDQDDDADIYMDYTGGTRVTSLIAMMLCRWLEVNNYKLRCAVYADITNGKPEIKDITDIYGMFNAIIAHDKEYDPDLQHLNAENRNESVRYGLAEYRKNKKAEYVPSCKSDGPFVFVSYAHLDHSPAQAIIQRLQSEGYRIWYDEGIPWGEYWDKCLKDNMANCTMALILLSPNYIDSDYCHLELAALQDKTKYVIWLKDFSLSKDHIKKYPFLSDRQGILFQKYNVRDFNIKLLTGMAEVPEALSTKISPRI